MKILIIEDEARIAQRIMRMVSSILKDRISNIHLCSSLREGTDYIKSHSCDLLFLDLNLNGQDGFGILESVVSESFDTIIVSAYSEKAIRAFEYGVLDFVPKPFTEDRLAQACSRLTTRSKKSNYAKYLAINKRGRKHLVSIENIVYIKGAGVYTEIVEQNDIKSLHNKSLDGLLRILPPIFERVHKSYIVNMNLATEIKTEEGSKYELILSNNLTIPIGRTRYKEIKTKWFG